MRSDSHGPTMKQINSSHIHAIGYDAPSQELHVEYRSGTKYKYKDVPPEKARMVMGGMSIGKAIHTHIRGQHDHEIL